ncbi:uncharacterized protein LOC121891968 [Scomber scombrus]|uniref:Uncharacterized protein LOC121891968 n=1 Tax=Scomber scombrus TaxID=13677 RepID=A0AAV1Q260_SCOSC
MNENSGVIVVVICKVNTGRHRGGDCQLLYTQDEQFHHECDYRFTLMTVNQTVFLNLTSLTPVDSGKYSCECSYERGTYVVDLDITVEGDKDGATFSGIKFIATAVITVTAAAIFITAAGIICTYFRKGKNRRENTSSRLSELNRTETTRYSEDDHYTSLQQPATDEYQTIPSHFDTEADQTSVNEIINSFKDEETEAYTPSSSVSARTFHQRGRGTCCPPTLRGTLTLHCKQQCDCSLTIMGVWELWFALLMLLPTTSVIDCQVTHVKTAVGETYVAPICTNETMNRVLVVTCTIRTENSSGAECRLAYRYGGELLNGCDSRFTIMKKNQTFFLQLTSLTPGDSGNYSCECTKREGTVTLHRNITVEDDDDDDDDDKKATSLTYMPNIKIYIGVIIVFIIAGVILGIIYRINLHRRQHGPMTNLPNMEPEEIEAYSTYTQRVNSLYSTVGLHTFSTNYSNMFTTVEFQ